MPKVKSSAEMPKGISITTVDNLRALIETLGGMA